MLTVLVNAQETPSLEHKTEIIEEFDYMNEVHILLQMKNILIELNH